MLAKNALITGSTSGIGYATAQELAKRGCNIMLNGIVDKAQGDDMARELAATFQIKAAYSGADLRNPAAIEQLINDTVTHLGSIDILVNNAGVQHTAPIEAFSTTMWDTILAVNLSAAFHTIHHSLPHMKAQGWGRIINIASVHGLVASINKAAYVAAKHGIVGLTKVVALEAAGYGVTANAICPGWVETALIGKQIEDLAAQHQQSIEQAKYNLVTAKQALPEMTKTQQIGEWVAFLCSDSAATTTGASLAIDGGWTAQ